MKNELSEKIEEADFEKARAAKKYTEQIRLNSDYKSLHENYSYLQEQYSKVTQENSNIKFAIGLLASAPCEQVINNISDLKKGYNNANDYLNSKLRLGYQAAKKVTLTEKIEKYVSTEVSSKEILIAEQSSKIDELNNLNSDISNKMTEGKDALLAIGGALNILKSVKLPDFVSKLIQSIIEYIQKKLSVLYGIEIQSVKSFENSKQNEILRDVIEKDSEDNKTQR